MNWNFNFKYNQKVLWESTEEKLILIHNHNALFRRNQCCQYNNQCPQCTLIMHCGADVGFEWMGAVIGGSE